MPEHPHPLLHAGAGRFWKAGKERSSSSSNLPPAGRYQELSPGHRGSVPNDTASETFDPLLPQDRNSSRHSFSHSTLGEGSERVPRSPSIASGSSSASGESRYGAYSISALSLPNASSLQFPTPTLRVDRTASQAHRIRNEERKDKLMAHIRQLDKLEELRVSRERTDSGASASQRPLEGSRSYTSIRSAVRLDADQQSVSSTNTHRPSISDVASMDFRSEKRQSVASGETHTTSSTTKSTDSGESLPAALKLPRSADQPRYALRDTKGPMLHLDTATTELDPKDAKKEARKSEDSHRPKIDTPVGIEMNAVKSPLELHAVDAPWSHKPMQFELPTTRPTIKRKPYDPRARVSLALGSRTHSENVIAELPAQIAASPISGPSSTQTSLTAERQSLPTTASTSDIPKVTRPLSSAPDPETFRPSMSSQLLGLIPPQMPRRAAPTPLPAANTFELSASPSVVYRPRASSTDTRPRRRVSPAKLAEYNTVLHAPFPLLSKDEEKEPKKDAEAEAATKSDQASESQPPDPPAKDHKRLDPDEYLEGRSSRRISIEPEIDPRTGRRWVGSIS